MSAEEEAGRLGFLIETSIRNGEKELLEGYFFELDDDEALLIIGTEQPVTFDYGKPDHESTDESER